MIQPRRRASRVMGGAMLVAMLGCGGGTGPAASGGAGGTAGEAPGGSGDSAGASGLGGAGTTGAPGGSAGRAAVGGSGGSAGSAGSAGGGGGKSAGRGGSAGTGNGNCKPDVLLIQDRSGSMNNDENDTNCRNGCGANSKWSQLTAAVTTVVTANAEAVNWGLKYFPDNNTCGASMPPAVAVAPMNGAAVAASIAATTPGGNTPTRDAVTSGTAYLLGLSDGNPKFLVLATDGVPNCPVGCAALTSPNTMCTQTDNPNEDAAVEMALTDAAQQGIKTFVIGIGNLATAQNTLNVLAIAGGEPQVGAATSYYAASDQAALEAALTRIVGAVACP